jgi:hypothetical protein
MGRKYTIKYKEQIHAPRNNNVNSGYSNYVLNTACTYGTVAGSMTVICTGRKGRHLNTL